MAEQVHVNLPGREYVVEIGEGLLGRAVPMWHRCCAVPGWL